ncbi:MAG: hypothetical protein HND40_14705 [Ignavibacteriota bacterium]|nr:hypothetical protein [Ignavibacteriota bacterium]MCO6448082.1 hypothetical protein [Ignavibacterium album]MCZ2085206.1 hypothetical protein [Flavobacteriales bacterium]QKK00724.1 MAG: hypothetical protein HND40_14705 [Ignavibacteriota bacterium]HOJ06245.1 hypothetical protein [Ignavibacteriaceae bacterium]
MLRNPELISSLQTEVGAALWQCQALEESLVHILLIGIKIDNNSHNNIVEEIFKKYGELTLGQLANQIENISDIPLVLKQRLSQLKRERNWLAHKSWSDILPHANSYPPNKLTDYLERIIKINDEALSLNKSFENVIDERIIKSGVKKESLEKKQRKFIRGG